MILNNFAYKNEEIYRIIENNIKECNNLEVLNEINKLIIVAKDNSIKNENYLYQGNDIINDLKCEINYIKNDFIYNINSNMYKLNNFELICDVHNYILNKVIDLKVLFYNKTTSNYIITDILNNISKCKRMNNSMGNAIDKKNKIILNLQNEILKMR